MIMYAPKIIMIAPTAYAAVVAKREISKIPIMMATMPKIRVARAYFVTILGLILRGV